MSQFARGVWHSMVRKPIMGGRRPEKPRPIELGCCRVMGSYAIGCKKIECSSLPMRQGYLVYFRCPNEPLPTTVGRHCLRKGGGR